LKKLLTKGFALEEITADEKEHRLWIERHKKDEVTDKKPTPAPTDLEA